MARESCKSQIAVLEMNGQSVPQRWTSMREGSNTARRQCSAWNVSCPRFAERKFWRPGSLDAGWRLCHALALLSATETETMHALDDKAPY